MNAWLTIHGYCSLSLTAMALACQSPVIRALQTGSSGAGPLKKNTPQIPHMRRLSAMSQGHGLTTGSGQNRHHGLVGEPILGNSGGDVVVSAAFSAGFAATLASAGMTAAGVGCS